MVTIKDIAKACQVSSATVSKALNGYGDIGEETAERVRRKARELNYRPNAAARQLKTNRSNIIGVLFFDDQQSGLTQEFFAKILDAAKQEAENEGYDVSFISNRIGRETTSYLDHCRYRKYDGVLIACVDFTDPSVAELLKSDIPIVTIDYKQPGKSCIVSDNTEGMYKLTEHLIRHGHRKIAFIHGEKKLGVTERRLEGFYRALAEEGISVPEEYVREGNYHNSELCGQETRKLMELPDPPTAIMFPDDFSGIGGLNQLEQMGLRVGEDVSVTGYDGLGFAGILRPALTTYRQNMEGIGKNAIRKLIAKIENPDPEISEVVEIQGYVQEGKSIRSINQ